MRLNFLLASSLLGLTIVSALPRPQRDAATLPAASATAAMTLDPAAPTSAAAGPQRIAAAEPAEPEVAAVPSEPNIMAPSEPDPVAVEYQPSSEPSNGEQRAPAIDPLDVHAAQQPEQGGPGGIEDIEAQHPEGEEGDAQDTPDEQGQASSIHARRLDRRADTSADGQVAPAMPADYAEAAGSPDHHHHHHKRFHYRKSLRDRHRRRRIIRNQMWNTLLTGKQVNYGSMFYHKATGSPTAPVGSKSSVASQQPASDLTYMKSIYSGQKGSVGRQNRFRLVYLSDHNRRRRHMKVRHN
ncbi:hypothetical protein HK101_007943 [Irineochytrium annulatum]|nr:hypothetical protein HK101_007943 [Irineochytrium annulatum]